MAANKVDTLLAELEEVAAQLDIRLRYEVTRAKGGLCQVDGKFMFILDRKAAKDYRLLMLARAIKSFDLSNIYLSPKLREYLDEEV
ncbi:hypothetical protein [Seleniivibrio woodruffii]|uniref:Uncharacterized protein n=1 Tax=Seleniivibrio woodruffii TaxID=1078050 RepID=A0A4R1KCF1_9BACT|nr:hypothetical protein [Seleniivibrio woodruffii]TCK62164.1 hypothetical protein C8D98_0678 [Seleniivibrio woodruffii]TVZ34719.1 hypothetical protein OF66_0314 [Seleniivibrio woodruffii]